jgi:hypothetical protein
VIKRFVPELYRAAAAFWHAISGNRPACGLPFGLGMSVVTGFGFARLHNQTLRALQWLAGGSRRNIHSDLLFAQLGEFLGNPVLVSLSTGKIYMGLLIRATEDPNESDRYISVQPILSGVRHKETQRVTFDTDYRIADDVKPKVSTVLLPMRSVVTISSFDFDIHKAFIERGITTMGVSKPALPAATPPAESEREPES